MKTKEKEIVSLIPHIHVVNESAILLEWNLSDSEMIADEIHKLYKQIIKSPFEGFLAAVPAYITLTIYFDPIIVNGQLAEVGATAHEKVKQYIIKVLQDHSIHFSEWTEENRIIQIPVFYGGQNGPDIAFLSESLGIEQTEIIRIHTSTIYKVSMMGFMPGFTYLSGLDPQLHFPRKNSPRNKVPAGSVGIAGAQTGIYALESPGGWQIIGKTEWPLFDPYHEPPVKLRMGDRVQFLPIS
jgi:inhibitor of KinA